MTDSSSDYDQRKAFYRQFLTLFGRKPVLEALQEPTVECHRLHLADSNKPSTLLDKLIELTHSKGGEVQWHSKKELSRISKNSRQDQGVAADIRWAGYQSLEQLLVKIASSDHPIRLLALDGITNPQNVGMILRSATAGKINGVILPNHNGAGITPLTIKASAGTVFRSNIFHCEEINTALSLLKKARVDIAILSSHANKSLFEYQSNNTIVYVLGNESEGVSQKTLSLADTKLKIPMNNGVESLNVAVTAALISFL